MLAPLYDLDEAVGQLLLAVRRDPFNPAVILERHRPELLHLVALRIGRAAIDVDVIDRHFVGRVGVLVEPLAESLEPLRAIEHADRYGTFESLQDLLRLFRERELPGRGQVPPLVAS